MEGEKSIFLKITQSVNQSVYMPKIFSYKLPRIKLLHRVYARTSRFVNDNCHSCHSTMGSLKSNQTSEVPPATLVNQYYTELREFEQKKDCIGLNIFFYHKSIRKYWNKFCVILSLKQLKHCPADRSTSDRQIGRSKRVVSKQSAQQVERKKFK